MYWQSRIFVQIEEIPFLNLNCKAQINIVERDVQSAFAYNPHLDFGEKVLGQKVFRMY